MVLSSQSPREGHSRLYMVSRKRRSSPLRWLVLLIIVAAVAYGFWWALFSGPSKPTSNQTQAHQRTASAAHNQSSVQAPNQSLPPANHGSTANPSSAANKNLASSGKTTDTGTHTSPKPSTFTLAGKPQPTGAHNTPTAADNVAASSEQNTASQAAAYAGNASGDLARGMNLIASRHWVQGRKVLSHVLFADPSLSQADAATIRDTLTSVNKALVFSSKVYPNDPLAQAYQVQPGDLLARIAPRYHVPYQFIEQINGVKGRNLRAGQTIKLIKGPFDIRIIKHLFLMDVYLRGPDGLRIYVCSFPVGLGKQNSTPVGLWIIQPGHKVINPRYDNDRTGEHFGRNDPRNPVGNYWMALEGIGPHTKGLKSYGIHGTINPASIGHEDSLGCIRLRSHDIKQLFYMLEAGQSKIHVLP